MKTIKVCPGLHFRDLIAQENWNLEDQSIYFLLPDIPSTVQAEQVFIEKGGLWGERLLTFAKLSGIVNVNLNNPSNILSRTARLLLSEQIVSEHFGKLNYYREIVDKRAFSDSILRVIAELKHSNIKPNHLDSILNRIGSTELAAKIDDIYKIYSCYDLKLNSLSSIDDIDALRVIIDKSDKNLIKKSFPQLKKLIVFGFNEFTETQREVLESLDNHEIELTLCEYELKFKNVRKDIELRAYESIVEEAQYCARKVKWLIEKENVLSSKIAIVCKSSYENSLIIKEEFQNLGIEYSENDNLSLKTSQIGQLLLSLINAKLTNFKKNKLFELLRNPYVINYFEGGSGFFNYLADLELFFLKERIPGGLGKWPKSEGLKKLQNSQKYSKNLISFLEKLDKAFNSNKVVVLTNNLLSLLEQIVFSKLKQNVTLKTASEINAINSVYNLLSEYRFIISRYFSDKKAESLNDYSNMLLDLVSDKKYSLTPPHNENRIKKLDFLEARGTAFEYLFVLGASENVVPNKDNTDPIIKNNERQLLNKISAKDVFKSQNELIQIEEDLVSLIINCSQNVFASYVNKDSRASLVQPSYILNNYNFINRDDTYNNLDEMFITKHDICENMFSKGIYKNIKSDHNTKSELYFIANGISSELRRHTKLNRLQDNEGFVEDSDLLKALNRFSVTELEAYGLCPFRYFASHILKLRFPDDIEDEPMPLDQGSVYHKILNALFTELSNKYGKKLDFRMITDEQILLELNTTLGLLGIVNEFSWLSDFKQQLNTKSIMERVLPAFILKEAERIRENNSKGFFPAEFEKELSLEINSSTVEGKADRIDLSEDEAIVIDYKLKSLSSRAFCDYKNLQLPVYLNSLSSQDIGRYGAYYRSTEQPDKETGKSIDSKDYDKELELSLEFVKSYIDKINNGIFPPCPQKKDINFFSDSFELAKEREAPCSFCEYSDLCRAKGTVLRTEK